MVKDNRLTPFADRVITKSEVTDEIKENCLTPFDDPYHKHSELGT